MGLADSVADVISGQPGVFGVYARNLATGETIAIDADRILPAESAAKTFSSCTTRDSSRLEQSIRRLASVSTT